MPHGRHRVDARGAARRDVARHRGDAHGRHHDGGVGHPGPPRRPRRGDERAIGEERGGHPTPPPARTPRRRRRGRGPASPACSSGAPDPAPQRHPNPELARPPLDGVRHHAVDPDGRHEERDGGESAEGASSRRRAWRWRRRRPGPWSAAWRRGGRGPRTRGGRARCRRGRAGPPRRERAACRSAESSRGPRPIGGEGGRTPSPPVRRPPAASCRRRRRRWCWACPLPSSLGLITTCLPTTSSPGRYFFPKASFTRMTEGALMRRRWGGWFVPRVRRAPSVSRNLVGRRVPEVDIPVRLPPSRKCTSDSRSP